MTPTAAPRAEIDADADGLVLPKSPTRGRSAPALPAPETGDQSLALALRTPTQSKAASIGNSGASKEFCDILRSIARTYSSRPPESLAASGIFVVTDVDCVRAALQASPRLALENTLTDPSEILRCTCCRRDEYDLKASRRVPKPSELMALKVSCFDLRPTSLASHAALLVAAFTPCLAQHTIATLTHDRNFANNRSAAARTA